MAGNKQHHVWQMLQRGFGEKRGKDHHVWVYRKVEPPEQTVTRLFGFQKHFYGPEGSPADSLITNYENENQSTIQEIRKLPHGAEVDPLFASTLISHLEMRSAFLREDISRKLQKGVGGLIKRFQSPETLRAAMIAYLKANPDKLDRLFGKSFIPPQQRAAFAEIAHHLVEILPDHEILGHIEPGLDEIGDVASNFPSLTKAAQNETLSQDFGVQLRVQSHLKRDYQVFRPNLGSLILPDTTLAFIKKDSGATPCSQKDDVIEAVILPLASDVAIIGKATTQVDYPLKTINRILAGCSFEAFLAKENAAIFRGLVPRIGKYAHLMSEQQLARIVAKL